MPSSFVVLNQTSLQIYKLLHRKRFVTGISLWAESRKCRILNAVRKPPLRAAISRVFNLLQGISHVVA